MYWLRFHLHDSKTKILLIWWLSGQLLWSMCCLKDRLASNSRLSWTASCSKLHFNLWYGLRNQLSCPADAYIYIRILLLILIKCFKHFLEGFDAFKAKRKMKIWSWNYIIQSYYNFFCPLFCFQAPKFVIIFEFSFKAYSFNCNFYIGIIQKLIYKFKSMNFWILHGKYN